MLDFINEVDKLVVRAEKAEAKLEAIKKIVIEMEGLGVMDRLYALREISTAIFGDKCEICEGKMGGIRGNENIINGRLVCDYCHANMEKDS